jgi:hypothetical protein
VKWEIISGTRVDLLSADHTGPAYVYGSDGETIVGEFEVQRDKDISVDESLVPTLPPEEQFDTSNQLLARRKGPFGSARATAPKSMGEPPPALALFGGEFGEEE